MILNTVGIKDTDIIQENRDIQVDLDQEAILIPDIFTQQKTIIKDDIPEIEALEIRNHINPHIRIEKTTDHKVNLTVEVSAEANPIYLTETDQIP